MVYKIPIINSIKLVEHCKQSVSCIIELVLGNREGECSLICTLNKNKFLQNYKIVQEQMQNIMWNTCAKYRKIIL